MSDSMDKYLKKLRDFDSIQTDGPRAAKRRVADSERKSDLESRMANSITQSLQAHSQVLTSIGNHATDEYREHVRLRLLALEKIETDQNLNSAMRELIRKSVPQITAGPSYTADAPIREAPAQVPPPPPREERAVTRYASHDDKEWEATGIAADYAKYSTNRADQIAFQQLTYNRLTGPGFMWSDKDAGETYDRAMEMVKGTGAKEER